MCAFYTKIEYQFCEFFLELFIHNVHTQKSHKRTAVLDIPVVDISVDGNFFLCVCVCEMYKISLMMDVGH